MKRIILNRSKLEIRGAILEDDKVVEIHIERYGDETLNGDIYKGKVANVLPGMESAFINIGLEKNAFLHVEDLIDFNRKEDKKDTKIENLLKVGDEIIVQVISDPRDTKGARVTTNYTIPGKYLVLTPNNSHIAISKKIKDDKERERLEEIFTEITPEEMGVIIRTAAEGKTIYYFEKELQYLINKWREIEGKSKNSKIGEIVYKDNGLVERLLRDVLNEDIGEVIVDNEDDYWEVIDYIRTFSERDLKIKVILYKERENIFKWYGIDKEIFRSLKEKVELECGGSIVIQKTEALVSIDVNTGKNIGRDNLQETVLNTNIEAAREIAKQLRLRNLSGIIIIDFIDMKEAEAKEKVIEVLDRELQNDRIKTNIIHFTDLGLVEMTRKRQGKPLSYYYLTKCDKCDGTGKIESRKAIIERIFIEIKESSYDTDMSGLKLYLEKELLKEFKGIYWEFLKVYLETKNKKFEIIEKNNLEKKYEIVMEK